MKNLSTILVFSLIYLPLSAQVYDQIEAIRANRVIKVVADKEEIYHIQHLKNEMRITENVSDGIIYKTFYYTENRLDSVVGLLVYDDTLFSAEHFKSYYYNNASQRLDKIEDFADNYTWRIQVYNYNNSGHLDTLRVYCNPGRYSGNVRTDTLIYCEGYAFEYDEESRKKRKNRLHRDFLWEDYFYDDKNQITGIRRSLGYPQNGCIVDMTKKLYSHTKMTYQENGLIGRVRSKRLIQKKGKKLQKTRGYTSRYKYESAK